MKQAVRKLSLAAVAVIVISVFSATTALAVGLGWHEKLIEFFNPTQQQIEEIAPAIDSPEVSVSENGVTVTVKQTIADSTGVYVLYEILAPEGFEFTEDITTDGHIFDVTHESNGGEGTTGMISAPAVLEDMGNRRTAIQYYSTETAIVDGTALLILRDLQKGNKTLIEGEWRLEWDFAYTDFSETVYLSPSVHIGENRYATELTISPISISFFIDGRVTSSDNLTITVNFKDGSQIAHTLFYSESKLKADRISVNDLNPDEITSRVYHSFDAIIDINDIESLGVGEALIPLDLSLNSPSSWALEAVHAAIKAGLVPKAMQSDYTQTTTRAEFCALAVQLYETVMSEEITKRVQFDDTTDINVQKMAGLGVVDGVGDNKFSPNGILTREQAATMLSRLADAIGKPIREHIPTFNDNSSISAWAFDAVGQMQITDIMNGIDNNTFAPQGPYTREQSIVTLMRLYNYQKQT
jgi:hypothetical protein